MIIKVQTAQNVEIEYEVAGLGDRILAWLIDALIVLGYAAGLFLIFTTLNTFPDYWLYVTLSLPVFLYDLLFEIFMEGQSPGKRQMRIKVIRLDGSEPTIGSYFLRWILRVVDVMPYGIGALMSIAVTRNSQRLGDLAAGTTVVRVKPMATLEETIMVPVDLNYVPVYPQVTKLSDRDISIIKEVLEVAEREANYEAMNKLAWRVSSLLGITPAGTPNEFLHTVLKDYNAITAEM